MNNVLSFDNTQNLNYCNINEKDILKNKDLVKCICVLSFDDSIGQIAESIYPPNSLEKILIKQITVLGFPETNGMNIGDNKFIFKIRKNNSIPLSCSSIIDQEFFYCYSFFIQIKDKNYKRGYIQKSIVIISSYYLRNYFFHYLIEINKNISNDFTFSLPKIEAFYNLMNNNQNDNKEIIFIEYALNIKDNYLSEVFPIEIISKICNLWEMVILETPLIILADTPNVCSEAVITLSNIISPLKYVGDIRPYFTILDDDFKEYKDQNILKSTNSPILGIINPICLKMLNDWAVIHLDSFNKNKYEIKGYKRKFIIKPNSALLKILNSEIKQTNENLNMLLKMYLKELNNDFIKTFEEYFFSYDIEYLKRISYIKKNLSVFEIFNKEKFNTYLKCTELNFNIKYIKDIKKTIDLYSKFIDTKIFNAYLKSILPLIEKLTYE